MEDNRQALIQEAYALLIQIERMLIKIDSNLLRQ